MKLREKMSGRTKLETLSKKDFDGFRKECLRYGKILKDKEWFTENKEIMRKMEFHINGFIAHFVMKNGEVIECGLSIKE